MSLSPRRLLRPWRTKSFLAEDETISAVDYYDGQRSKKQNHGITVAAQSEDQQLDELLTSLGSIVTDASTESSREQAQAQATRTPDQRYKTLRKKVKQPQSFVSRLFEQESNAQDSRDDNSSPSPFVREIQYTYRADNRPTEDRDIKELFTVPPPDGNNLRTVQELLEGSDSLPPWLRDMLVRASVKVKQIPCTPNDPNIVKDAEFKFIRCEDDVGISASLSEAGEEGATVMSSFSELSETMEDSANLCSWFTILI